MLYCYILLKIMDEAEEWSYDIFHFPNDFHYIHQVAKMCSFIKDSLHNTKNIALLLYFGSPCQGAFIWERSKQESLQLPAAEMHQQKKKHVCKRNVWNPLMHNEDIELWFVCLGTVSISVAGRSCHPLVNWNIAAGLRKLFTYEQTLPRLNPGLAKQHLISLITQLIHFLCFSTCPTMGCCTEMSRMANFIQRNFSSIK